MVAGEILAFVLLLHILLVYLTVKDARTRGHSEFWWGIFTIIFGIFAIIIYLLIRNDQRLPEAERPEVFDWVGLGTNFSYIIAFILIILVSMAGMGVVGEMVSTEVYPMPEGEVCAETGESEVRGEETCSEYNSTLINQRNQVSQARANLTVIFVIIGLIGPILTFGVYKRQDIIEIAKS